MARSSIFRWMRRMRRRMRTTIWVVPAIYGVLALAAAFPVVRWDERDPLTFRVGISPSSAGTALAALGSGMIAFTGFVTSVVLLIVQFSSTQFSSRFVRWFKAEPTIRHALGNFIATFVFALIATALSGAGPDDLVPYRALAVALILSFSSIGWFLALLSRSADNFRVAHVAQRIDAAARGVFDRAYPVSFADARAHPSETPDLPQGDPIQTIVMAAPSAILQSFDRRALVRLASAHDATIELLPAVGEHVWAGREVARVYGRRPVPVGRFWAGLGFGDERTFEDDPAFAVRLLVDVAIKALSPAINDPTTSVQCLHRIEDLLRYAASKHLAAGVQRDQAGAVRLLYRTPTWDDLVELALAEIRVAGVGHYQVARRCRALLTDLLHELPLERHDALLRELELLERSVVVGFADERSRSIASVPDRQGLGLSEQPGTRS